MRAHLKLTAVGWLALALSGCPVTDDYFIDTNAALGGSGQQGGSGGDGAQGGSDVMPQAGSSAQAGGGSGAVAGSDPGGATSSGGTEAAQAGGGGAPEGGAPDVGAAGDAGAAGSPSPCVPTTERCNGHDDNCNDVIDEQACNSQVNGTTGCAGFVLPSQPEHGYMLCTGVQRDYSHAQEACAAQDMRLAWIESSVENQDLATKVDALANSAEVLIGATDSADEGAWFWDEGSQFWNGNQNGKPVNGAFTAWASQTPNNGGGFNTNEDCGVLISESASWADRACSGKYAYVCEEIEP